MNKMQLYYSIELTSSEARRLKKAEKTLAEISAKRRKHTKFTQRLNYEMFADQIKGY
jgi:hypothetical protein